MLTRVALTLFAAGAVAAGAGTSLVNADRPADERRAPRAEAQVPASGTTGTDGDAAPAEAAGATAPQATLPPCPTDVAGHGAYVSSVARGDAAGTAGVDGREHGALVSEAARSDCGKPGADDEAETDAAKAARRAERAAARAAREAERESRRDSGRGSDGSGGRDRGTGHGRSGEARTR